MRIVQVLVFPVVLSASAYPGYLLDLTVFVAPAVLSQQAGDRYTLAIGSTTGTADSGEGKG